MLGSQGKRRSMSHETSALPGGINSAGSVTTRLIPWRDLVGMPLPPKPVLDRFMSRFFDSVDWFMMVSLCMLFPGYYLDIDDSLVGFPPRKLPTTLRENDGLHFDPGRREQ